MFIKDDIVLSHLDGTPSEKRANTRARKKKWERVRQLYEQSNSGRRQQWLTKSQKGWDFFLNDQLTEDQLEALVAAGMPTFIINRITPVIETMKYFVTANNPRWKAVGVGGDDVDLAEVHTDIIDYCWYMSGGKSLFPHIVLDSLAKGKGYLHITVDPDADRGLGEVKFERIDPYHVYVPTMSRDFLERDAHWQMIKKDMPRSQLIKMLPEYESVIKRAKGVREQSTYSYRDFETSDSFQPDELESPVDREGKIEDILPYYEVYEPLRERYYNLTVIIPPPEAELKEAKQGIDEAIEQMAKELEVEFLEKQKELQSQLERGEIIKQRYDLELQRANEMSIQAIEEQKSILYAKAKEEASKTEQKIVSEDDYEKLIKNKNTREQIVNAVPYFEKKIKREVCVGDQWLYEMILPISSSPLIPLPYLHTDTPLPMSAVIPLIGKQQEINKSHQIMVHNANLSSNLRWLYVEGELDEDIWEKYSASPNALLPYRAGFSPNGPREILPQNINNAFFTIEQDSKSDIEYIAGIQPPSMGVSNTNDETYRGFLAKDEYGTRRIRAWINNTVEPFLEHTGQIFQEMAKEHYSIQKIFRIVQPGADGGLEERSTEINIPLYDDRGEEIGRYHDYSSSRYDMRIIAGSTLPINRWAVHEENKVMFEMGVLDDIAFIQEADIKNKEALIDRKSMLSQAKNQIENQEDEIKQLNGDIDTLRRQILQMGIKSQIDGAEKEIDRSRTETKMVDKLTKERMRDELKNMRTAIKQEIKAAIDQVKKAEQSKKNENNEKKT